MLHSKYCPHLLVPVFYVLRRLFLPIWGVVTHLFYSNLKWCNTLFELYRLCLINSCWVLSVYLSQSLYHFSHLLFPLYMSPLIHPFMSQRLLWKQGLLVEHLPFIYPFLHYLHFLQRIKKSNRFILLRENFVYLLLGLKYFGLSFFLLHHRKYFVPNVLNRYSSWWKLTPYGELELFPVQ